MPTNYSTFVPNKSGILFFNNTFIPRKALSIVRIRRQLPKTATIVTEFGDCRRVWTGLKRVGLYSRIPRQSTGRGLADEVLQ